MFRKRDVSMQVVPWSFILLACSAHVEAPPDDDAPSAQLDEVEVEVVTLAEVAVGASKVSFGTWPTRSGDRVLVVREDSPADHAETPFGAMLQARELTSLEMFRAIAPQQEPPALLVEAHPVEARRLGREDMTPVEASIDLDTFVPKTLSSCEAWIWAPPPSGQWSNKLSRNYLTGSDQWLAVGTHPTDWGFYTHDRVTFGVCNRPRPSEFPPQIAIDYKMAYSYKGDPWEYSSWYSLDSGWNTRWWNVQWLGPNVCVSGGFCMRTPTRYAVACIPGPSQYCHLKSAVRSEPPPR